MQTRNELLHEFTADNHSSGPGSAERQAEALAQEGVEVTTDSMGEMYVDFSRYGWFPSELPSEATDEQP
jgi:methylated-DNA-protein-cysteine methyltransferase-like protein